MKMKKLTALALAGVLCLGMSTTAFASPSVDGDTAVVNKDSAVDNEDITPGIVDPKVTGNEVFEGWVDENISAEKRSEKISKSFEKELKKANTQLKDEDYIAGLTTKEYKQLQEKQAVLEELANPDVKYELISLDDLQPNNGVEASEEDPITVRYNLNGKFEDIDVGQVIRILHLSENGQVWEMYETTVKHDSAGYYAEWDFTHFSPVAVMRATGTGLDVNDDPAIPVDPTQPVNPADPTQPGDSTVNGNGTITADQLADLIVQRLQQNSNAAVASIVRTAGRPSPKTGE